MYKQLIESCRRTIEENRCLGCTACGEEDFIGNIDCKYSKATTAEESMKQIKLNLRKGYYIKTDNKRVYLENVEEIEEAIKKFKEIM